MLLGFGILTITGILQKDDIRVDELGGNGDGDGDGDGGNNFSDNAGILLLCHLSAIKTIITLGLCIKGEQSNGVP